MSQQAKPKVIVLSVTLVIIIVIASVLVPWPMVAQAIVNIVKGNDFTLTAVPQTIQMVTTEAAFVSVTVHRSFTYATYNLNCNPSSSVIQCSLYPPYGVANPDFTSTLTITTMNAPVGKYSVSVRAIEAVEFQIVTVTVNVVSTQTTTATSTTTSTTSMTSSASSVNTMGLTFLDVTPTARLSEEQYGYVLARGGLDPNVKSLKVQLPHDDTAVFRAGIQQWYDGSIKFTQLYGGSTLYDAYPISFTTEGVDSTGDENVRVIYASPVCGQSSSVAIACFIPNNNGVAGLWTGGTIYFDTYYRDTLKGDATRSRQDIIRTETTHEFGHLLGLGDFYRSPTCFGYTSSVMCYSNPLSTIDEYAAIVKWHQIQATPPQSLYGILALPSNMINAPLFTSTTTTAIATTTTTAIISFQNGGFETGDLTGWPTLLGSGNSVSNTQHHSGSYSLLLQAPVGGLTGVHQNFVISQFPVAVTAYWYNVQWPSACGHSYTEWTVGDDTGHVIEVEFMGSAYTAGGMQISPIGYYTENAPPQPLNTWIKWTAIFYSDHVEFYLNDVLIPLTPLSGSTWSMSHNFGIQLFNSCSAITYIDDVQITQINQPSVGASIIEAWDRFWAWVWCRFGYCS